MNRIKRTTIHVLFYCINNQLYLFSLEKNSRTVDRTTTNYNGGICSPQPKIYRLVFKIEISLVISLIFDKFNTHQKFLFFAFLPQALKFIHFFGLKNSQVSLIGWSIEKSRHIKVLIHVFIIKHISYAMFPWHFTTLIWH